jgi:hypothetical protein
MNITVSLLQILWIGSHVHGTDHTFTEYGKINRLYRTTEALRLATTESFEEDLDLKNSVDILVMQHREEVSGVILPLCLIYQPQNPSHIRFKSFATRIVQLLEHIVMQYLGNRGICMGTSKFTI